MQKFVKKPIVVKAYQVFEEQKLNTLEGVMTASPGDWIVEGIKGEKYPVKPDIFQKTYSKLDE
ncbi:hypothetical protein JRF95_15045 [Cytobacillus horneckiae]|nr:hypothetical protein [Cytobacillus horneckiae]MBN6887780.1 hypothetical protein [Cytobacillus horneckiae]